MDLLVLVIYCFVFVGLSIIANRKTSKTIHGYFLADRSFSGLSIAFTMLGTYIGGATMIGLAGQISRSGLSFIGIPLGVALAFFLLGIYANKYRTIQGGAGIANTLPGRLIGEYGSRIAIPTISVLLFVLLSFVVVQIYTGNLVIGQILVNSGLNVSKGVSLAIFSLIVLVYTVIGGTKGDVLSDTIQILIILVTMVILFISLCLKGHLNINMIQSSNHQLLDPLGSGIYFIIASILLPTFSIHTDSGIQQRLFIAKSNTSAKRGAMISSAIYFVFSLLLIAIITISVGTNLVSSGDNVLFDIARTLLGPFGTILLHIAILSAVLSTINTELILISGILNYDILKKSQENRNSLRNARVAVIVFYLICLCFSFILNKIFNFISALWVLSLSCFGIAFLGLIYKPIRERISEGFIKWQIIICALLTIVVWVYAILRNIDASTIIIPLGLVLLIVTLLIVFFRKRINHE